MKVAVVKCNDYDSNSVRPALAKAVELLGGLDVKKGDKVLLKPNLLSASTADQHHTTHPAVVREVCRILHQKGAEIWIGDSSGAGHKTADAYKTAGVTEVAEEFGAKLVSFEKESVNIKIEGRILNSVNLGAAVKKADFIINLPKLKTHSLTKYTGAIKNMFGVVPGGGKSKYHRIAPTITLFSDLLLDVYSAAKPNLTIMDAVIGLEGNGPGTGGLPKKTGLIIASKDGIALDMAASKIIGYDPMEIKMINQAIGRGMFDGKFEVVGEDISAVSVPYKKPITSGFEVPGFLQSVIFNISTIRPKITDRCKKCNVCVKACPASAIELPDIDRKRCILCYCCHELCPHNAIELNETAMFAFLRKAKHFFKM